MKTIRQIGRERLARRVSGGRVEFSSTLLASRWIAWLADSTQLLGRYGNQLFGNGFKLVGSQLLALVGEADQ